MSKTHRHAHGTHKHNHDHKHSHSHAGKHALLIALGLTLLFSIVEAISGWWSNSLALMGDAGHMASDSLALGLAAFAAWIAKRPPSAKHTYGLGRAEIVGAWFSSVLILVIAIALIIEAIARLRQPHAVHGGVVISIASVGIIINFLAAWILSRGEKTLNVRAAILHVIGDLLGSVAALISGAVIYFSNWSPIDPILSIFISILIIISSFTLLRESLQILMEGVPHHIDINTVGKAMSKTNNVSSVHDLHIWTLSSGTIILSAHVEIDDLRHWQSTLQELMQLLAKKFGITHVTLQPENHTQVIERVSFE